MKTARAIVVGALGVATALSAQPAHAAALSGTLKGGAGSAACGQSVSCIPFSKNCALPPEQVNDLDGSVRLAPAAALNVQLPLRYTVANGRSTPIVVQAWNANCMQLLLTQRAADGTIVLPATTKWVTVVGVFPHAGLTWSIG